MTFEEWLEAEFPARSEYDFENFMAYESWKRGLRLAWNAGYSEGWAEGFLRGDYCEGIEEGIKIGRLQP